MSDEQAEIVAAAAQFNNAGPDGFFSQLLRKQKNVNDIVAVFSAYTSALPSNRVVTVGAMDGRLSVQGPGFFGQTAVSSRIAGMGYFYVGAPFTRSQEGGAFTLEMTGGDALYMELSKPSTPMPFQMFNSSQGATCWMSRSDDGKWKVEGGWEGTWEGKWVVQTFDTNEDA